MITALLRRGLPHFDSFCNWCFIYLFIKGKNSYQLISLLIRFNFNLNASRSIHQRIILAYKPIQLCLHHLHRVIHVLFNSLLVVHQLLLQNLNMLLTLILHHSCHVQIINVAPLSYTFLSPRIRLLLPRFSQSVILLNIVLFQPVHWLLRKLRKKVLLLCFCLPVAFIQPCNHTHGFVLFGLILKQKYVSVSLNFLLSLFLFGI